MRRLLLVAAATASVLVLGISGSGYALISWSSRSIERVDAFSGLTGRPAPSAAGSSTFLLVGSDAREGMSRADMRRLHVGTEATAAGRRADTMLLVHVSARHGAVRVVSLPRDSYVTIPAHVGTDGTAVPERRNKLNAAYAFGGPPLAVATIERTTGVRVDHYVEVDFMGFVRLVDAVGGVDVCSPVRLRDRKAGLRLPAGTSHVDGETGLAYVRARNLDARADLGRVERQQRFLAAMVGRATSSDVLLDPRSLVRFLDAALSAVRADPGLTQQELLALGTRLRHVSGEDIRFQTVPVADPSFRSPAAGSVALWDEAAATRLFTGMREDSAPERRRNPARRDLTVDPGQVRVQVYNGAGTAGLGSRAGSDLANRGFDVVGPAQNWRRSGLGRTTVHYDTRYTESIKTMAAALPGARLVAVPGLGRTLQVIVGTSYAGTRAVRVAPPAGVPAAADEPRTAAADPCA
ncbi:MAG: LCP family protein [Spirochaetaceae bacterium]|nr:LCP family protein [Spirochaetaceae bacterium]